MVFSRLARTVDEEGDAHARKALALGGALLLPAGLLLTAFAPALVRLIYGPAFAPAGQLLRVLTPAAVLLGLSNLLADNLRGGGRPCLPTFAMLVGLGVTIPGLAFALPRYGMWGAAWVSLFAYGAMLAVEAASFLLVSAMEIARMVHALCPSCNRADFCGWSVFFLPSPMARRVGTQLLEQNILFTKGL